ncbi:HIT-like protein [Serendipita vermifera]|nr:HIT-like protein [Serendipita vermifera]
MLCGVILKKLRPEPDHCVFCDVADGPNFKVVSEDANYTMFVDRTPAAIQHYLVIPKKHIESVRTLSKADVPLVRDMWNMGERYFDLHEIQQKDRRFGFHIPPFNSVDHLHLHCFVLPFTSNKGRYKYSIFKSGNAHYTKGWGWFVEVQQAIDILEKGSRIGVSRC